MALEVTGFDIQVSTKTFDTGMRRVAKNLRNLERQANTVNASINKVFRLRENQIVGNKAFTRLGQLKASVDTVTASLAEMAAASQAADAAMARSAASSAGAIERNALAAAQAQRAYTASAGASTKLASGLTLVDAGAKKTTASLTASAAAAKKASAAYQASMASAGRYTSGATMFAQRPEVATAMQRSMRDFRTQVAGAVAQQGMFSRVLSKTRQGMAGLGTAAAESSKRVVESTRKMSKGLSGVHSGAMRLRYLLASMGGFLVLAGSLRLLSEYQFRMSGVQAITAATAQEMQNMDELARHLGATTMKFAREAAHGMRQLAQAGFTAREAMEAIGGTLDLSIAGTVDMGSAVEITATSIRAFNMEAWEAVRVADVLAKAATSSNTTIILLGESLRYVAPIAASVGMDIETTAAAIGILGNAGIKGSMAGASLRRVISSLVKPTAGAHKAIERLGLSARDLNPTFAASSDEMSRLVEIMYRLRAAGMGAREAFEIFGLRGGPAATALAMGIDRFAELEQKTRNAAGAAQEMARIMGTNLRGDTLRLISTLQELVFQMGEQGLLGATQKLVQHWTQVTRVLGGIESPLQEGNEAAADTVETLRMLWNVLKAVAVATGITWLLGFFKKLIIVLVDLHTKTKAVSGIWGKLATAARAGGVWGRLAIGIAGVGAALYHMATRATEVEQEVSRMNERIAKTNEIAAMATELKGAELIDWGEKYGLPQQKKAIKELERAQINHNKQMDKAVTSGLRVYETRLGFMDKLLAPITPLGLGQFAEALLQQTRELKALEATRQSRDEALKAYLNLVGETHRAEWEMALQKLKDRELFQEVPQVQGETARIIADTSRREDEIELLKFEAGIAREIRDIEIDRDNTLLEIEAKRAAIAERYEKKEGFFKGPQTAALEESLQEQLIELTRQETAVIEGSTARIREANKTREEYTKALSDQKSMLEELMTPHDKYIKSLERIQELSKMRDLDTGKPFLSQKEAAELISNATDELIEQEETLQETARAWESFDAATQGYAASLKAVQTPTERYNESLELLTQRHERIWGVHAKTEEAQAELARMVDHLTDSLIDQEEAFQYLERGMDSLSTVTDRWVTGIEGMRTPLQQYHEDLEQIAKDYERLIQVEGDHARLGRERAHLEDQAYLEMIRAGQQQEAQRQEDAMTRATAGMPTYARDYVESTGLVELGDVIEKMGSEQLPILSDAFSDFFGDLITGSANAKEALLSLANEVARSGTRILVEFLMSRALQSTFKRDQAVGDGGPGGAALAAAGQLSQLDIKPGEQTSSGGGQPAWMKIVGSILSLGSMVAGGVGGAASGAWGALSGMFGAGGGGGNLPVTVRVHKGGIAGSRLPTVPVHPAVFAGAQQFATGGMVGFKSGNLAATDIPAILHRGELVSPLKGGRLPVTMTGGGSGYTRTPGGTTVPLDVEGDNDGWQAAPVIFQRGAIMVVAQKGERLDETSAQAVRRAFAEGARQNRRNRR
jgi:TP901 family phage tail tape measure protein